MSKAAYDERRLDGPIVPHLSLRWRALGLGFLVVAVAASAILVLGHFGVTQPPGCGTGSACAAAARGRWGTIAAWPTSFFGLAYFLGMALGWARASRKGISPALRWTARLGAGVSVFYVGVILAERLDCLYCVTAHAANLAFWLVAERAPAIQLAQDRYFAVAAGVFALSLAALNVLDAERRWKQEQMAERQAADSIEPERAASRGHATRSTALAASARSVLVRAGSAESERPVAAPAVVQQTPESLVLQERRLDGRYVLGSADAPVRLVLFFDYQCEHCQRLDRELKRLRQQYSTALAISIRHYPLCTDCNYLATVNTHPNACRAARAAEAAGLLRGTEGFWQFHDWLIEREASFSGSELRAGLADLGYESADAFLDAMGTATVRRRVLEDIVEAEARRVGRSPAVLVNGVLLKGGHAEPSLSQAIAAAIDEASRDVTPPTEGFTAPDPQGLSALAQRSLPAIVSVVSEPDKAQGSGVIVKQDGPFFYVLTAQHLLQPGARLAVRTFPDTGAGPSRVHTQVEVIARSPAADDLAVLRVLAPVEERAALPICPSDFIPEGGAFQGFSVGCTQGERPSVTVHRSIEAKHVRRSVTDPIARVWETMEDAQRGRSGGPLVDVRGRVIGIQSGSNQGKGYYCHAVAVHQFLKEARLEWLLSPEGERTAR